MRAMCSGGRSRSWAMRSKKGWGGFAEDERLAARRVLQRGNERADVEEEAAPALPVARHAQRDEAGTLLDAPKRPVELLERPVIAQVAHDHIVRRLFVRADVREVGKGAVLDEEVGARPLLAKQGSGGGRRAVDPVGLCRETEPAKLFQHLAAALRGGVRQGSGTGRPPYAVPLSCARRRGWGPCFGRALRRDRRRRRGGRRVRRGGAAWRRTSG